MNRLLSRLLFMAFLVFALSGCMPSPSPTSTPAEPTPTSLRSTQSRNSTVPISATEKLCETSLEFSILRGLDFLYQNQLPYGEFRTLACRDKEMEKQCHLDSSPFITTFVLYSIKDIKDERVEIMTNAATGFLLSEQQPNGAWNVYTSRNINKVTKPPDDADDTACASAILYLNNIPFRENLYLFNKYRNSEGVVNLWFGEYEEFQDYDCEVNSNILFYFGLRNIHDHRICSFINDNLLKENYSCCIYCEDRGSGKNYIPLFYLVSRAYKSGNSCFNRSKEHMLHNILVLQKKSGSFGNELDTALALNTLMNLDYYGIEVGKGINTLLQKQLSNGSWKRQVFYIDPKPNYFGSEELTTALAIEAMQKYLQIFCNQP